MAEQKNGNFIISYGGLAEDPISFEKSGLVIGRLASCDIVLNQSSVSRVHAGINYLDGKYVLINLSSSNVLTLNGRRLDPRNSDVLANGDIIQIGPFIIDVDLEDERIQVNVRRQLKGEYRLSAPKAASDSESAEDAPADVLKVFWEKRTREKENPGSRLRPVGKPEPGKAVIKWKPTADLRPPWRTGLFIWIFLIFAAFAVLAFWRYPQTFASKPLASPHIKKIDASMIANRANENSCTTCHSLTQPVETACITCHQAEQFHASNTGAHEAAGITCTACHSEHRGENFDMREAALNTCAQCHNDNNKQFYNGQAVRTAHGGSFGYPAEDGKWTWKGLHTEIAETVPAVNAVHARDETEQAALSRQFHAAHVSRLEAPAGMAADARGRVSCSTCHASFAPVDRVTPRQTCASCHNTAAGNDTGGGPVNCVSCHVQHPFSTSRWDAFLTPEARTARKTAVDTQIKRLNEK
jgi:pSer/pThr/pTyr-binding forkhead associated (FHA) protein